MVTRDVRQGYTSWTPTIAVSSTDLRILDRCKEIAGGKITSGIQPSGNAKQAGIWTLKGKNLNHVLPAILPINTQFLVGAAPLALWK